MLINPVMGMVNDNYECQGTVQSLKGQRVLFTGTTSYRGEHRLRKRLEQDVRDKGRFPQSGTRNRNATILVRGGLHADVVVDYINIRSQTLVMVDEQAEKGRHICIVDDAGFETLFNDRTVRCLQIARARNLS